MLQPKGDLTAGAVRALNGPCDGNPCTYRVFEFTTDSPEHDQFSHAFSEPSCTLLPCILLPCTLLPCPSGHRTFMHTSIIHVCTLHAAFAPTPVPFY